MLAEGPQTRKTKASGRHADDRWRYAQESLVAAAAREPFDKRNR